MDLQQKCLTLFVSGKEKQLFLPKVSFWPKTVKTRKNYKIVVSAEIAQNLKRHFFRQRCFGMGQKVVFTNCIFEKLCSLENTIFIVFSAKHSSCSKNVYVDKKIKFMKNSGLFLNMAKRCFLFVF